ncbi:hypothetical protein TNIN_279421 [Trichonephila inaurata madagascariensis]|uniref:Uncharacterized protein n=1 Tax=Trichonephila inaurata madagascariensis TaxID=2747483 RepID=A0A8X6XSY8_9ARAC|nr:hypothetical protein TNIN_279421 [Trichonephila inaurata madagascariensis]
MIHRRLMTGILQQTYFHSDNGLMLIHQSIVGFSAYEKEVRACHDSTTCCFVREGPTSTEVGTFSYKWLNESQKDSARLFHFHRSIQNHSTSQVFSLKISVGSQKRKVPKVNAF